MDCFGFKEGTAGSSPKLFLLLPPPPPSTRDAPSSAQGPVSRATQGAQQGEPWPWSDKVFQAKPHFSSREKANLPTYLIERRRRRSKGFTFKMEGKCIPTNTVAGIRPPHVKHDVAQIFNVKPRKRCLHSPKLWSVRVVAALLSFALQPGWRLQPGPFKTLLRQKSL